MFLTNDRTQSMRLPGSEYGARQGIAFDPQFFPEASEHNTMEIKSFQHQYEIGAIGLEVSA
jgi:hypothetical protein